jgi:NADH-quinone oxidoreductase subunit G
MEAHGEQRRGVIRAGDDDAGTARIKERRTTTAGAAGTPNRAAGPELATLSIDGNTISVPKGTLVIRAAELMGIAIPRFCDHPLLDPVGACRQCLVEIEGQRKPMASCTIAATDDMVVHTQFTSETAGKAQRGVMELLLINHPLDCPMCDKGGECPLQNQAMSDGRAESRYTDVKRTFAKPINVSSQVLLDRERCVLCARCTRFSEQIAGDPFIEMLERGALQQVGIYANEPFESYFSGNTVQICPVGALTGTAYRFRARPYDLVSTPSVCEHCASGCAQRTDHRRGKVLRRLAGDDPEVNEEWNCDKGRWAFTYATQLDRITTPLVRDADGLLVPASWPHALAIAVTGLESARGGTGVLVGGRLTWEDAYAYAKFARIALGTNDIDFRSRPHSSEEAEFLAARIVGERTVSYADLESAPVVLLVGFEPEDESPIVFLRLRKAARKHGLPVYAIAPFASRGLQKMSGRLVKVIPGAEAAALDGLGKNLAQPELTDLLATPGAVIMVGERLATVSGGLSAVARLADATGARLAWVPRRAGERGALEAGALSGLLPGGRPVADDTARSQVCATWRVANLPTSPGRDTDGMLAAAADGTLGALLVGGVEPDDLADPEAALAALDAVGFVVSLELRHSAVTERADVVFPVAPAAAKSGTYVNWEGRYRGFSAALHESATPDLRVLDALADEMGVDLGLPSAEAARSELIQLGSWDRERSNSPDIPPAELPKCSLGEAIMTCWRMLLDEGLLQDGEPYLAGTAPAPVVRLSAESAAEIGAADGDPITVSTSRGAITLPLAVTDMPERVVWLPLKSAGSAVYRQLGVTAGSVVRICRAGDDAKHSFAKERRNTPAGDEVSK